MFKGVFLAVCISALPTAALAGRLDPELVIKSEGYESSRRDRDGTVWYVLGKRESPSYISALEDSVDAMSKDPRLLTVCDLIRGGVKASLIERDGLAYDVAVTNYGYEGATIVCVLKYMYLDRVGTQVIYSKRAGEGMYMLVFKT